METDTIAAIATALSDSGIGIIRVSGEKSIPIVDTFFYNSFGEKKLTNAKSHTIHYGFIVDSISLVPGDDWKKAIVDEVMVSVMKAPKTYTKEDTVEINCHGGVLVIQKVLNIILQAGARLAEPGEFTKRAFLNGRIDLSKAEAVMDLIHSQNDLALKSSVSQLKGDLSEKIKKMREEIIYEIAFIESALDDPEHISLDGYSDRLNIKLNVLISELQDLIRSADNGKLIKEGISTVILGKPNAGKSSLLNILVGKERAIVTDIAGTTRDILEEHINLNGISLNIIDTAGIRSTEDTVEKIGVDRAKKYAKDADLIVYVVDSSVEIDDSDREIISLIKGKNTIILLNKSDKTSVLDFEDIEKMIKDIFHHINQDYVICSGEDHFSVNEEIENNIFYSEASDEIKTYTCSDHEKISYIKMIKTTTKDISDYDGIREFEKSVEEMFFSGHMKSNQEIVITNMRHKEALQNSLNSLLLVKKSIEDGMEEDFFSIDLMSAYSELGKIIGEEVEDDLVEEIFSKFCMGK